MVKTYIPKKNEFNFKPSNIQRHLKIRQSMMMGATTEMCGLKKYSVRIYIKKRS